MNRKHCYAILSKKFETSKIDRSKLEFESNVKLHVSENLTPYNQHLALKSRELKRAGVIHSSWSSKGIIKLRHTANEHPISIDHENRKTRYFKLWILYRKYLLISGPSFTTYS